MSLCIICFNDIYLDKDMYSVVLKLQKSFRWVPPNIKDELLQYPELYYRDETSDTQCIILARYGF